MKVKYADGSTEEYEDTSLAGGAEGEIFLSRNGKSVIKLYSRDPTKDAERIRRIDQLIDEFNPTKGSSYWAEFFTWPEKRVVHPAVGYRMRFAGGMKTLEHYILGKSYTRLKPEERGWFIGQIAVALKLVSAANCMSSKGLCYPDFSGKNILVDPFRGRMVLIDCDSLTVPGKLPPTVEGTSAFRAPEIVMRQVTTPSVRSDRHALAVILYQWLLRWHPLMGNKVYDSNDPDHDDELRYGREALYIEHPTDESNRAKKQVLKAYMLGPELEELFQKAFVDGLHQPDKRPLPYEWQRAFYHTYDHIIPCSSPYCGWRFFVAARTPQLFGNYNLRLTCPRCEHRLNNPRTLPFIYLFPHRGTRNPDDYDANISRAHYVIGWPKRALHKWHIKPEDAAHISTDVTYVPDPAPYALFEYDHDSEQWYLYNLALRLLSYTDSSGTWKQCSMKERLLLVPGMSIQFGNTPEYFRAQIILERVI
jgi:serine/threonine protein kinase